MRNHHIQTPIHVNFRYRFTRLPFGATIADDIFQRKTNKIFKEFPDVFGIVDDILIVGYHNEEWYTL